MNQSLREETERLRRSWMQHEPAMLRDYLVSAVEDPRLNQQSILTRRFLLTELARGRYDDLLFMEMAFGLAMNWLRNYFQANSSPEDAQALLHALERGADDANGLEVPSFLNRIFLSLPACVNELIVPHYIRDILTHAAQVGGNQALTEQSKSLFMRLWPKKLARCKPARLSVLEPACGSANDYRFLDACGLARLLKYTGFDLCEKNIANARQLFPAIDFRIGNVFEIDAPDKSFDACFVHDLFEHLSVQALDVAIAEICRVTRKRICAGFFNLAEEKEHVIQPVADYHWNRLSMDRMRKAFLRHAKEVQVIHIGTYVRDTFPDAVMHNENAYSFFINLR